MSYQVLARKWRPRTFPQMVGQEHVLRALINALDNDRLHHAFLFTGTRGVGKTSVARILAKSINCERGVSATPCGECSACREIDEGRFVDLIEVDAASRTKVEDTRELLENVQYAPSRGRYKVYLIDEVHMLSGHSFNALLKTLEEPPPHVKFLLATTDPQKLPVTILSRCLQFSLKRLPLAPIRDHLAMILQQEGIAFEADALLELAYAADGSMRDALSLLDQAIAHGGGEVRAAEVRAMLGTIDRRRVYALLAHLAAADGVALMAEVQQWAQQSPDYAVVLNELNSLLQRLALAQLVPDALEEQGAERDELLGLAQRFSPEQVQLYYQIGILGRRDLPLAPTPRQGFEVVLLRMLAFRPESESISAPVRAAGAIPATATSAVQGGQQAVGAVPPCESPLAEAKPLPAGEMAPPVALPASQAIGVPDLSGTEAWAQLVARLPVSGMTRQLAEHCALLAQQEGQLQLVLEAGFHNLHNPKWVQSLNDALDQYFGMPVRLDVSLAGAPVDNTPRQLREAANLSRQQQAETAIAEDPQVRSLLEQFDAGLIADLIRPV